MLSVIVRPSVERPADHHLSERRHQRLGRAQRVARDRVLDRRGAAAGGPGPISDLERMSNGPTRTVPGPNPDGSWSVAPSGQVRGGFDGRTRTVPVRSVPYGA